MMFATTSSLISNTHRLGALACLTLGSLACASNDLERRDLGNTTTQELSSNEPPATTNRTPLFGADRVLDTFVEGHWVGQAEDLFSPSGADGERPVYAFPSGSTDVTLDISLEVPGFPTGQLIFGSGTVPEPLAGVAYPPGFDAQFVIGTREVPLAPVEGFAYSVFERILRFGEDGGVPAGALALSYAPNGAYDAWCPVQTSRPNDNGGFDCATPLASDATSAPDAGGSAPTVDPSVENLCQASNVCACTEADCQSAGSVVNHIWLIRDGDDLLGTLVGAVFDYGNPRRLLPIGSVRFERVAP